MACRHLEQSSEAYEIGDDDTQRPCIVHLCAWADNEPEKLVNAPRWLQRNSLSGHLLRYPDDCMGCPAFAEAAD